MKPTGIVRRIDTLGRVVIPVEIRRQFELDLKDPVEFYTEGDTIVLKKYQPTCIFCGDAKNNFQFNGKNICEQCAKAMQGYINN